MIEAAISPAAGGGGRPGLAHVAPLKLPRMPDEPLEPDRCARLLRAMADRERLKIIQCLRGGPKNVSEIAESLGAEIVNVSHHLGVLRQAGIVLDERQGRFIVYQLHPDVFQPARRSRDSEHLDLGCCRLEIPGESK